MLPVISALLAFVAGLFTDHNIKILSWKGVVVPFYA